MLIIAIEITICVILGVGLIIALILYNRTNRERFDNDKPEKIDFLPTSINEEILVHNILVTYYEQQRHELVERQKMILDESKIDMTTFKNDDSGYTSMPSSVHTPYSVYECTGLASMDNVQVSNPLFAIHNIYEDGQMLITPSSITK